MKYETICHYCGKPFSFTPKDIDIWRFDIKIISCPSCRHDIWDNDPRGYPWRKEKDSTAA